MGLFKYLFAAGLYLRGTGTPGYPDWSRMMLRQFGPELSPFLRDIRLLAEAISSGHGEPLDFRVNCWDFMGCGKHGDGTHTEALGTCPAAIERRLDGAHGGRNAGRACWVVPGTLCGGNTQGAFAQKFAACMACDFYLCVADAEGSALISSRDLRKLLAMQ